MHLSRAGYLPRFNTRFSLAAEQLETAYRPLPDELSVTETICLKDSRKVARDNTVKYQWRILQLLPEAERPSYAGLRVDVLEQADGELMIRYQGQAVDFQEGPPPSSALWGEGTGHSPSAEGGGTGGEQAASHLDEDQRKLLAALESPVEKRASVKGAAVKGRTGEAKPLRHQLHRDAHSDPEGPLGSGAEGQETGTVT